MNEISRPLGIDMFIGLPASEDARTANMIPARVTVDASPAAALESPQDTLAGRALGIVSPPAGARVNSREFRAAELPAGNGTGNARALARMYGAAAQGGEIDGIHIVEPEGLARATHEAVAGHDVVLDLGVRRAMGFILCSPEGRYAWGPNPRTFGHSGAGGSLGFADPDARIGFGYAMNQMSAGLGADPRWKPLIDAVYGAL
jgi:CubicO group peptidase (beta-lactamase class C family)